jgi:SAM-dependent methyltransferase
MVDDPRCVRRPIDRRAPIDDTGLDGDWADLVLLPNIVHHIRDQGAMFRETARILRPGGRCYIFEALIRELHQIPDDYVRYTPWGFERTLGEAGLEFESYTPEGGPFSAIAYCWVQALEYFPEAERREMEKWYYEEHLPQLMRWDEAHPDNLARQHTAFPVGYSVYCRKPS